jgi:hypothetical protein
MPNFPRRARPAAAALSTLLSLAACQRGAPPSHAVVDAATEVAAAAPVCPPPPPPPVNSDRPALGLLQQPKVARLADKEAASAVYSIGEFPSNPPPLRPGPEDDRHLLEVYCIGCHSTAYIAMQPPLSRQTWEAEVAKMRSAYGAVVPDPAEQRIATFLHSYYGGR